MFYVNLGSHDFRIPQACRAIFDIFAIFIFILKSNYIGNQHQRLGWAGLGWAGLGGEMGKLETATTHKPGGAR